ncbi:hypothetical protein ACET3X_006167 [Alternaria dauci]|uniref:Uncharacterized protein n=1 Tax=Alternaria dauci TaxID=48095 RepID=A0ABR3UIU0_9PLEO
MPYKLRPEAKLKRPIRYEQSDGLDRGDPPGPRSENQDSVIGSDGSLLPESLTANPSALDPSSVTTGAPHPSQDPPLEKDTSEFSCAASPNTSDPPGPPESQKMANVKYVKGPSREDAPPESKRARRSNKTAKRVATPLVDEPSPAFSASRPSAFPSLTGNAPPLPSAATQFTKHGLRELVEAMDNGDDERAQKIRHQFAAKYEAGTSSWYSELKRVWPTGDTLPIEIIERILDDFAERTYPSRFYPVCRILDITKERLDAILAENARVWTDDEIPVYFRIYRKRYPTAIIDPDEPSPQSVIEAIAFLMQNNLPGSLLGEWQTVPAVEKSVELNTGYIAKSIEPAVPARPAHQSKREHPDTISSQKAFELLWRIEQDALERAIRKQRCDKKQPQPRCRTCGKTGHTYWELDKNGVHACPRRRQEVAQHNAELEILRAQASAEIKAFKERDLAKKDTAKNGSQARPRPIDAAPYLEAWQANRASTNTGAHLQQPTALHEDGRTRYINQLQMNNRSHPGWVRNRYANRWSTPAAEMSTPHVAGRPMNPPDRPLRPQTTNTSANSPLWPNSTYLAQQQGISLQKQPATPQVSKRRGPYKKQERKERQSNSTPVNRVVGRGGMVFLSGSKQVEDGTALQKSGKGADATVETGLITPPPQQQQQQQRLSIPSSTLTYKARETLTVQRNAGVSREAGELQHPTISPVMRVSETTAVSAMDGNRASATVLPPYPYQVFPAQKPRGARSLKEMAKAALERQQVHGGKDKVPTVDKAP